MGGLERRILVVDDHRSFAEALTLAIDAEDDLTCVASAGSAADGLSAAVRTRPDVALVDLHLPDHPGTWLVEQLHVLHPQVSILALTAYADAASVAAAARAGVRGFLRKECSVREIVNTVRAAGEGPVSIDATTLASMVDVGGQVSARDGIDLSDGVHLTSREVEVLELLYRAFDAQRIAKHLGISIHTARGYLKSLLSKFDAHSQLELVVRARDAGVFDTLAPLSASVRTCAPSRPSATTRRRIALQVS